MRRIERLPKQQLLSASVHKMPIASHQVAKHRCGLLTELVQPLRRHQTTGEVERSGHAAGSTIAVSLTTQR